MKRRISLGIVAGSPAVGLLVASIAVAANPAGRPPANERLAAGADDPLFATYAAARDRSRYTPDEGYHFRFYDDSAPVAFTTDRAGEWGIAYAGGAGEPVVTPARMVSPPVIEASYPDLVRWRCEPLPGLVSDNTFLVHSSGLAVWEVALANVTDAARTITLTPFIDGGLFLNVRAGSEGITFLHEHPADGWTRGKGVPHPFIRHDLFTMHPASNAAGPFAGTVGSGRRLPEWVEPEREPENLAYGRLLRGDGSRVYRGEIPVQVIAYLAEQPRTAITLDCPIYGSAWREWKDRGYYVLELAELPWAERAYEEGKWVDVDSNTVRIVASAPDEGIAGTWARTVSVPAKGGRSRHDITLTHDPPPPPVNLTVTADTFGLHLSWDGDPGATYRVFRMLWKVRQSPEEKARPLPFTLEHRLDQARGGRVFRLKGEVKGTSYDLDLRRRVQVAGTDARAPVAYRPESDLFARHFFVATVDEDGHTGSASETVSYWPSPPLAQVAAGGADPDSGGMLAPGVASRLAITLAPGARDTVRVFRAAGACEFDLERERWLIERIGDEPGALDRFLEQDRALFRNFSLPDRLTRDQRLLAVSAFNLLRQCMLPPEGRLAHDYYVFSREPTWGWGHGGQVFHESLSVLPLARLDPRAAEQSMRVFEQVQRPVESESTWEMGYIPYRVGPYLDEVIETNGEPTSSGPFYTWITSELFKRTRNRDFLAEMVSSCEKFVNFWRVKRDTDRDGFYEWGGHAVLESLRDANVVIWDEVAPPDSLAALGLNCMLVNEFRSLGAMLDSLGESEHAARIKQDAAELAHRVQRAMWDEETGFFYHNVNRGRPGGDGNQRGYSGPIDNAGNLDPDRFSYASPGDLKRKEIIGFLPLWAGIATDEQAERLVREHLTNPAEFWRPYGIPSVSADDPYYDPRGYWNGPVWVQWNYLIQRGLLRYGYDEEARELADRVGAGMIEVLRDTHTLWEFYSPEQPWGGWHQTYIWAGLIAEMMLLEGD